MPRSPRSLQVNLVGADAKQPMATSLFACASTSAVSCARTDADEMHVGNALDQFLLRQGAGHRLDLAVASVLQHLQRRGVQALPEET